MNKVAVFIAAGSGMGANAAKLLAKKVSITFSSSGRILAKKLNGIGFTGSNLNNDQIEEFIVLFI